MYHHGRSRAKSRVALAHSQLFLAAVIGLTAGALGAARAALPPAASPGTSAVMHLTDGSFAPGTLVDSTRPGVFRWHVSAFVSPFEFPASRVSAIHWPPSRELPKPGGDFCFELAGGDVLFGALKSLDLVQAELDVPRLGRLHIERSSIHRIYRWRDSADLVYLGPNGLAGWTETTPPRLATNNVMNVIGPDGRPIRREPVTLKPGWREEAGQLVTDRE